MHSCRLVNHKQGAAQVRNAFANTIALAVKNKSIQTKQYPARGCHGDWQVFIGDVDEDSSFLGYDAVSICIFTDVAEVQ
jgi:hypothetical protein